MWPAPNPPSLICVTSRGLAHHLMSSPNQTKPRLRNGVWQRRRWRMADKSRMSAALRPIDLDKMRKKFRVRKAGACIAIDLDGSTLRAVQTAPRGDGFFVSRIIAEPLGLPADSDRNDPVVIGRAIASTL